MTYKRCSICGETKTEEEFPRDGKNKPRRANCKLCENARTKERYHSDLKKSRDANKRYDIEYKVKDVDKWRKMKSEHNKKQREKHPHKEKARKKLRSEIRAGRIQRQCCDVCGEQKTHAHHDDYSKPLCVRWLCVKHHNELHYGAPQATNEAHCGQ